MPNVVLRPGSPSPWAIPPPSDEWLEEQARKLLAEMPAPLPKPAPTPEKSDGNPTDLNPSYADDSEAVNPPGRPWPDPKPAQGVHPNRHGVLVDQWGVPVISAAEYHERMHRRYAKKDQDAGPRT